MVVAASGGAERKVSRLRSPNRADLLVDPGRSRPDLRQHGDGNPAPAGCASSIWPAARGARLEYPPPADDVDRSAAPSPDGRWIVFVRNGPLGDFWRLPAQGGRRQRLSTPSRRHPRMGLVAGRRRHCSGLADSDSPAEPVRFPRAVLAPIWASTTWTPRRWRRPAGAGLRAANALLRPVPDSARHDGQGRADLPVVGPRPLADGLAGRSATGLLLGPHRPVQGCGGRIWPEPRLAADDCRRAAGIPLPPGLVAGQPSAAGVGTDARTPGNRPRASMR